MNIIFSYRIEKIFKKILGTQFEKFDIAVDKVRVQNIKASSLFRVTVDVIGQRSAFGKNKKQGKKLEDCLDTFGICDATIKDVVNGALELSTGGVRRLSVGLGLVKEGDFRQPEKEYTAQQVVILPSLLCAHALQMTSQQVSLDTGHAHHRRHQCGQFSPCILAAQVKDPERQLGDAGPLNDNQLACIRYAVKKVTPKILEHVDSVTIGGSVKHNDASGTIGKKNKRWEGIRFQAHRFALVWIIVVIGAILAPILAVFYHECPEDTFKRHSLEIWCSPCPAGTGTGGRVGQTTCRPSCDFWLDSQGRSCKDYDASNALCSLSDSSTSIRDLNGISGDDACYACMNAGSAGCIESDLPIKNVMKQESGVAAVGLVVSANNQTIYISDVSAHRILAMSVTDMSWKSLCGGAGKGFQDAKDPSLAKFDHPRGLAINVGRNVMYVADEANHAVRAVDLASGEVSTLAGSARVSG